MRPPSLPGHFAAVITSVIFFFTITSAWCSEPIGWDGHVIRVSCSSEFSLKTNTCVCGSSCFLLKSHDDVSFQITADFIMISMNLITFGSNMFDRKQLNSNIFVSVRIKLKSLTHFCSCRSPKLLLFICELIFFTLHWSWTRAEPSETIWRLSRSNQFVLNQPVPVSWWWEWPSSHGPDLCVSDLRHFHERVWISESNQTLWDSSVSFQQRLHSPSR